MIDDVLEPMIHDAHQIESGARDLPVARDAAEHPLPAHSLADAHIFGHVRLGPSSTWICGVCDDAGERVAVRFRGSGWTHEVTT